MEEKKNREEKGEHYLEKKNIFFLWTRRKTEKERGNYFEKENVFFWRRRKSRKIIGDWKNISFVEEEEKE